MGSVGCRREVSVGIIFGSFCMVRVLRVLWLRLLGSLV